MLNIFYQSHAGSWAILLLFFFLSYFLQKHKWLPMVLRIFYLIMLISGIGMLVLLGFPLVFVLKGILAISLIGTMEMLLVKKKKAEPHTAFWGLFAILTILVILFGYNVIQF